MWTRCADHARPLYSQKLVLTSLTSGDRSAGVVRLMIKGHGVVYIYIYIYIYMCVCLCVCVCV
jgi:hypothetical protein